VVKGIPFLQLDAVSKNFPGVKALDHVGLSVYPGEVHGLVGENGAGKSTLIKIIMGVYQKDEGSVRIEGKDVVIPNVIEANSLGLGAVYQDLTLALDLSIGENFFMGEFPRYRNGLIDWKTVYAKAKETLSELNVVIDPRSKISELSPAMQEMVAIAKAVHKKSKLIIFDEPTALLSNEEVDILFGIIKRLRERGVAIIYISHRIEEIFAICDTVTILKDGHLVRTLPVAETDEDTLIALMVGRSISEMYSIQHHILGDELLRVAGLCRKKVFEDITFSIHKKEIFGFFGLVGSGRTEIVRAIFGADPVDSGDVYIAGKKVRIKSPTDGIRQGIGFLPEDRKEQGLALKLPVKENINLASYKAITKWSFVKKSLERKRAQNYTDKLRIKTPSIEQTVKNLSGGNQQKVVIGKWLCRESDIFIFDEPTVGIDVGAKQEVYRLMQELTEQGHAVILISSYLPEVMGLSDRIGVIHEGRLVQIVPKENFTEEALLRFASGLL
jgi:ribose transport system ATP-binding protein